MKREIKFRGLMVDCKGWVYGSLVECKYEGKVFILKFAGIESGETLFYWVEVNPKSVGQFTGFHDAKGIDIYEGDIVKDIVVGLKSEIFFTTYANFGLRPLNNEVKYLEFETIDDSFASTTLEVIGNIHEK